MSRITIGCRTLVGIALLALVAAITLLGVPTAQSADCTIEAKTPTTTTITFDNRSSGAVTLNWRNDQCEEVAYETVQPGLKVTLQTYASHVWHVRSVTTQWLLREVKADTAPKTVPIGDLTAPLSRAMEDRDDDVSGHQVHILYVLPNDGNDRKLDTNGAIVRSVAAMQFWFAQQTAGRRMRLDTRDGALDITFVKLARSGADLRGHRLRIRDEIEWELRSLGFTKANKLYAVFYDGDAVECGGGPAPPDLPGNVGALYLLGTPAGATPCGENALAKSVVQPDYWEFSLIHEILHVLGLVARCAPHHTPPTEHTAEGHVSDSPQDLMYAGKANWRPSILDVGRNDYFEHGNPDCADLARSIFLDPLPAGAVPPPKWGEFPDASGALAPKSRR
jgi:hypothetical protein